MSKIYTLIILLLSSSLWAQPKVPDYGKFILVEEREVKPHHELGIDGGIALDNSTENVYSINFLGDYVFSPLFSLGLELTHNVTEEKDFLARLKQDGNVKITSYTPNWFGQVTFKTRIIKGHLNLVNKWRSPFELAAVLGGGLGYNDEHSKTSSLVSWGGELLIPFKEIYKAAIGIRHYKSYPFQDEELSFTSLLVGVRRSF